jgi:hypothetical protein
MSARYLRGRSVIARSTTKRQGFAGIALERINVERLPGFIAS